MQRKQAPPNFDQYYQNVWITLQKQLSGASIPKSRSSKKLDTTKLADTSNDSDCYDDEIPSYTSGSTDTSAENTIKAQESVQHLRQCLQENKSLKSLFPIPKPPPLFTSIDTDTITKLADIQKYITSLTYNHFGSIFSIKKGASSKHLMHLASEICRFGLPIKCLEAVVVAAYLTNEMYDVDRYALSFKSKCQGQTYRHIVLAVKHKGKVGALGLSRRVDLMDKPVQFDTIEALVQEYRECYVKNGHVVVKVKVGGLVPRDLGAKVEAFPWPSQVLKNEIGESEAIPAIQTGN
ncbi:Tubulinyl-Tyr carboxypeptidase 2 [Rhizoclosmatium sp. JEL0117]|nr:Tubulinyl-Tyr carboxypeptidase 2 [Rhizoclosmatium sp. JEL0117]